ncbi:hypothetical protein Tco_0622025 [Tanacetum coccineum]
MEIRPYGDGSKHWNNTNKFDESNANVLERFYTSAGNHVKEILLKLNLPDHRILKDGGEVKEFQRSFHHSDTEHLSRSDEVLKLKNFKTDATLKLFKSTNQERFQAAHDRQKSYADIKRKPLKFQVGDRVMLKVSPWKGVVRFGKRGKLNPRYDDPFKVIERVRTVTYKLELPQQLSRVHNTFHVSSLKKCLSDESLVISLEELRVDDKLHFVEEPVEVMDREIKQLKRSRIPIIKVRWNFKRVPDLPGESAINSSMK